MMEWNMIDCFMLKLLYSSYDDDYQINNLFQRTVIHNESLLRKEPPKYRLHPEDPFVEGVEDHEIDFVVKAGGFHILPLNMKVCTCVNMWCQEEEGEAYEQKDREVFWAIQTDGSDIGFRVLFRDVNTNETVIEPLHRVGASGTVYQYVFFSYIFSFLHCCNSFQVMIFKS